MKSGVRGFIISALLFLFWGTFIAGPFRYLALAFRNVSYSVAGIFKLPAIAEVLVVTLFLAIVILGYLLLSARKPAHYFAGGGAILSVLYYIYICFNNRSFDGLAFPVALGLAVALIFLLFDLKRAGLWLGDAYFFAVPVLLFYEFIMTPLYRTLQITDNPLAPFIDVESTSLATRWGNVLSVPMLVWGIFLFVIILLPVAHFSKDRKKG